MGTVTPDILGFVSVVAWIALVFYGFLKAIR